MHPKCKHRHIKKAKLNLCMDKAMSIGETSEVKIENLLVSNSSIGIAVKDYGFIKVYNGEISNAQSCVEAYNKKQEFSGGHIVSEQLRCINSIRNSLTDEQSLIEVNFL